MTRSLQGNCLYGESEKSADRSRFVNVDSMDDNEHSPTALVFGYMDLPQTTSKRGGNRWPIPI